jgi:hypothetical protein
MMDHRIRDAEIESRIPEHPLAILAVIRREQHGGLRSDRMSQPRAADRQHFDRDIGDDRAAEAGLRQHAERQQSRAGADLEDIAESLRKQIAGAFPEIIEHPLRQPEIDLLLSVVDRNIQCGVGRCADKVENAVRRIDACAARPAADGADPFGFERTAHPAGRTAHAFEKGVRHRKSAHSASPCAAETATFRDDAGECKRPRRAIRVRKPHLRGLPSNRFLTDRC